MSWANKSTSTCPTTRIRTIRTRTNLMYFRRLQGASDTSADPSSSFSRNLYVKILKSFCRFSVSYRSSCTPRRHGNPSQTPRKFVSSARMNVVRQWSIICLRVTPKTLQRSRDELRWFLILYIHELFARSFRYKSRSIVPAPFREISTWKVWKVSISIDMCFLPRELHTEKAQKSYRHPNFVFATPEWICGRAVEYIYSESSPKPLRGVQTIYAVSDALQSAVMTVWVTVCSSLTVILTHCAVPESHSQ